MAEIFLYDSIRKINLTYSISSTPNWNLPMNESFFKLYKGSKNIIEFSVRNNDRKSINICNRILNIIINDIESKQTLIKKILTIVDDRYGKVSLVLEAEEINNWPEGLLTFVVMIEEPDGGSRMLYVDQVETSRAFLELLPGAFLGPVPSIDCSNFFTVTTDFSPLVVSYFSDVFPGNIQSNKSNDLQTAAVYLENFYGQIFVLGSLELNQPLNSDNVWFNITTNHGDSFSRHYNVNEDNLCINHICPCCNSNSACNCLCNKLKNIHIVEFLFDDKLNWVLFQFIPDTGIPSP